MGQTPLRWLDGATARGEFIPFSQFKSTPEWREKCNIPIAYLYHYPKQAQEVQDAALGIAREFVARLYEDIQTVVLLERCGRIRVLFPLLFLLEEKVILIGAEYCLLL